MQNLNKRQIAQVKNINAWTITRFHGNTKKVGSLLLSDLKDIVDKKILRERLKFDFPKKTNAQIVRSLISQSFAAKGTNYFKVLIEGNTSIYYASAVYGHRDYNKCRVFPKNESTLKLMQIFNKIVNKTNLNIFYINNIKN